MAFKDWSVTAASNVQANTSIDWDEGMQAASVNNSARETMAQLAAWRDLTNYGTVSGGSTGGSSNAFTLTCSPAVGAYAGGQRFLFLANHSITGAATLNVDGLGAKAIKYRNVALSAGDVASGDVVLVTYDGADMEMITVPRVSSGYFYAGGSDVPLADGGTGASLSDPGTDRIMFWDESANAVTWLSAHSGIAISGTSLSLSHLGIEALTDPDADRILFWDDTAGATDWLSTGTGLAISATTLSFSHLGLESLSDPNADRILFWDDSAGAAAWLALGTGLSMSGTTLNADASPLGLGALSDPDDDRILFWDESAGASAFLDIGAGLAISGTTLAVSFLGIESLSDPNADRIAFWDDSAGAFAWLSLSGLTISTTTLSVDAASDSAAGKVELATAAETTTGTDAARAVTPDGLAGSNFGLEVVQILVSDPNGAAIATGDGKTYFTIPPKLNGWNLVDADASVTTVSSSGTPTIQIHNVTDAVDMLSTRITIDANEKTSYTAIATPVISVSNDDVATGDILRIDIDVAGTGTKGLMVLLTFQVP